VHLFWGDERHVPPDHPDSNYGMAKATLIDHVPIPTEQVHRIRAEMPDAHDAAANYEQVFDDVGSAFRRNDHYCDLMLLGLGDDAHIASIFPGSELLNAGHPATGRRVAAVWAPHLNIWRITLTPGAILDSERILLLVTGRSKADAVNAALAARLDVKDYPGQLLRAAGDRVEWFLDRAAAAHL
jgi:6-phosphogluconolactonase